MLINVIDRLQGAEKDEIIVPFRLTRDSENGNIRIDFQRFVIDRSHLSTCKLMILRFLNALYRLVLIIFVDFQVFILAGKRKFEIWREKYANKISISSSI